jgi:hypothetical protein
MALQGRMIWPSVALALARVVTIGAADDCGAAAA